MASTLSQALMIKQFVCGMPLQERDSGRPIYWSHILCLSVAFSPDGQHIVSGSQIKTICVWNATTGEMWQAHLLVTQIQSGLWHSHQMASTLSQAQMIKQFVCGMPQQERQWQAHLLVTQIQSGLWHSHQMASTLSQALLMEQFVCGMPQQERQ
jgi:hypothetical protein